MWTYILSFDRASKNHGMLKTSVVSSLPHLLPPPRLSIPLMIRTHGATSTLFLRTCILWAESGVFRLQRCSHRGISAYLVCTAKLIPIGSFKWTEIPLTGISHRTHVHISNRWDSKSNIPLALHNTLTFFWALPVIAYCTRGEQYDPICSN